jgi:hypothetical protein
MPDQQFTFTGKKGDIVVISTRIAAKSVFDGFDLVLKDPNGKKIASGSSRSDVEYALSADGAFTIDLTKAKAKETGKYSLRLLKLEPIEMDKPIDFAIKITKVANDKAALSTDAYFLVLSKEDFNVEFAVGALTPDKDGDLLASVDVRQGNSPYNELSMSMTTSRMVSGGSFRLLGSPEPYIIAFKQGSYALPRNATEVQRAYTLTVSKAK